MSDTENQQIKLLEEIRDILKAQSQMMEQSRANNSETRQESQVQVEKYKEMIDAYKDAQNAYQQNLPKKVALPTIFLAIIALCLVVDIIMRFMEI